MMRKVAIVGAFDTKDAEFKYFRDRVKKEGAEPFMIDVGILNDPSFQPDVSAAEVAAAGGVDLETLRKNDRMLSNDTMCKGIAVIVKNLQEQGKIDGIVGMGGGQGSNIAASAMRVLPIGFPKVILSTLATTQFVVGMFKGVNDTMIMNTLVDVSGLNYTMRMVIAKAAAAVTGMVNSEPVEKEGGKPRIALTMLGITTPCVSRIQARLDDNGFETMVFHANGLGGNTMEKLIRSGVIQGVLDMTTYEVAANYLGIEGDAGPERMEAAVEAGIPQIVCPGSMDIMNFSPPESMPDKYGNRKYIMHISQLKVARTSVEENRVFGKLMADKLNKSRGKVIVVLPLRGLSYNDVEGKPFYDADANTALFESLRENLNSHIRIVERDEHINDASFADGVADLFTQMYRS
jgi:uncharacterized protein (UPF0261 family)